jgi:hypothetical protein
VVVDFIRFEVPAGEHTHAYAGTGCGIDLLHSA